MLCVSIAKEGYHAVADGISGAEMAEIRIEKTGLSPEDVEKIFSMHNNLIATCRAIGQTDEQRAKLLKAAIDGGAKWVDIEIEASYSYTHDLVNYAKKKGCKVIISYHNYDFTPDSFTLCKVVNEAMKQQADLVKVATQVNDISDNARLFCLYSQSVPMVALGMGELGKVTRVAALKMGAPFTFVSRTSEEATAPGQLTNDELNEILKYL